MNKTLTQIDWASQFNSIPWQTIQTRAPFWTSLLLVILIASAASDMTWLMLTPGNTANNSRAIQPAPQAAVTQQPRLKKVADLHLFGIVTAQAPVVEAPINAPKTSLRLVLRGIFSSDDPQQAIAIIEDAGREKLYHIGDTVQGGAVVHTIYLDRVILERNGRYETLFLPRDELPESAIVSSPVTSRSSAPAAKQRVVQASPQLNQMREMMKSDPQALMQQVRIEPVFNDGQISGYRFSHNDQQIMRALGITNTDVITQVNGYPLDDPSVLTEVLGQFSSDVEIQLTVERNGGTEVLIVK
ncbi:MAG: type II secretion system protein GspC [Gammaproteobacteria bacterium]|nr:type II secretion system protein GspC [Gammaproteobacteria bacterium]MDH5651497.1 type II secretion system protein GspC [Gammaproteobacteria bacterium]